ncbi:isoprenylcysteine carboxyl methyltransferase family protein [Onchocerca flexuosa]|uniref:Protein-S-isoprenylcysteine O-methyltransferase n=1 Tax=Onchocerca flexuosa TaxID=387005 RepID=A0A238BPX0_9BILA|nr:isoprenylcysteine carboxyl methyltransferase family protein [Onchocerca flexuosa]
MQSFMSNLLIACRSDIDVQHSLFSALFSITAVSVTYIFRVEQWKLEYVAFLLSIPTSIFMCGWRARWNAAQASFLGGTFTLSLLCAYSTSNFYLSIFAWYFACIAAFHYGEFLVTALTNRSDLNFSSYLLDHSSAYWAAALISWVEYAVEVRFLPVLKNATVSYIGLILIIFGEILRKLAMIHANGGFTHMIAIEKHPKHKLVTNGVYGFVRHPGYLGWLVWCLGTQVMLCNPICLILYSLIGWNFFNERIYWEERYLTCFFGTQYIQYRKNVSLGIPFIKGYESWQSK